MARINKNSLTFGCSVLAICALPHPANADTVTYSYDALGRLITSTVSGGPKSGTSSGISYDPAGNRTSYSVSGA